MFCLCCCKFKDRDIGGLLRCIAEIMKENNLLCLITLKIIHSDEYDYFVNNIGKFKIDD